MRNQENDLSDENLALIFKHIDKSFDEAQHTGQLNLSAKKLTGLPRSVTQFDLSDLHFADFSKNCLHHFPNFIFNFLSLEELDIHRNSIKIIPTSISQLNNLLILNIKSNQLTTFPSHACTLLHLQVLNLSSNRLSSLSQDISLLSSLMLLDVSNNLLTDLPDSIRQLSNLKCLDLHKNQLTSLNPGLSDVSLIHLDISVNHITHLPPTLHHIKTLETLNIDHNPLILPPPHVVIKGKEHVMAYLRRLKVEQNKRKLNEALRTPSKEAFYAGSWSSNVFPYRRQDSDTCLNHSSHFNSTPSHPLTHHGRADRLADCPPYANSTIDVASHRRRKEAFKEFCEPSLITHFPKEDKAHLKEVMVRSDIVQNSWSHKKPPFPRVSSFNSKQASMIDLSKRGKNHSRVAQASTLHVGRSKVSKRECEDGESGESVSSADSSRTLSVGSNEGDRWSGGSQRKNTISSSLVGEKNRERAGTKERVKEERRIRERCVGREGGTSFEKEEDNGVEEDGAMSFSIQETIKRTLQSMQHQKEPQKDTTLNLNLSHSDGFDKASSQTTNSLRHHKSNGDCNTAIGKYEDGDEDGEDEDDEDEDDVSEYEDGIIGDEEDENGDERIHGTRQVNYKKLTVKLPKNKKSSPPKEQEDEDEEEEEFVRKANLLRHQREFEASKIKSSLTTPPLVESTGTQNTCSKGLTQNCQRMLQSLSLQLNSQDPVLTIRRNLQHTAIEQKQARKLKKTLEEVLQLRIHGEVGASVKDGVLLCRLLNCVFPGSVHKIYTASQRNEKLSETKCRKNVENFLIACRKLGVSKDSLPTEQDVFEVRAVSSLSQIICHLVETANIVKQSSV